MEGKAKEKKSPPRGGQSGLGLAASSGFTVCQDSASECSGGSSAEAVGEGANAVCGLNSGNSGDRQGERKTGKEGGHGLEAV